MIPESTPVLLDTGILVHLCRGGSAAALLDQRYGLLTRRSTPWVSVVSVGEILALAARNQWGAPRRQLLVELLSSLAVVNINRQVILDAYAQLDAELTAAGRRMGQQNDQWIAATASATGALLLTTDRDFDALDPSHLRREWVDPVLLRSGNDRGADGVQS